MKYKVETIVTTYSFSVYLELENNPISLSYDGNNTYKSTDIIECDNELDMFMRVNGLNGTDWELKVTVTKNEDPGYKKELKDKKGTITNNQTARVEYKLNLA